MPGIPSLHALSKRQVVLIYGLTEEDIKEELIDKPVPLVPPHHQVDPRSIEAYLGISEAPTFSIGTQEISLISPEYRRSYRAWKGLLESSNRLVQSPLGCSTQRTYSEVDDLHPSFRAGLVRWRNGYLRTYHYFDDCFLLEHYYNRSPGRGTGIALFAHRTPSTIYATSRDILLLCPRLPTAPIENFQSLSEEHKEGIYRHIEKAIRRHFNTWRREHFAHQAIAWGKTGPNLPSVRDREFERFGQPYWVHRLPAQRFVIGEVCKFQVIASQSYANFPSIDQLRQILLDRYGQRAAIAPPYSHVQRICSNDLFARSSWVDGESAPLSIIQPDEVIETLYFVYNNGCPSDSSASTDSLFDESDDE